MKSKSFIRFFDRQGGNTAGAIISRNTGHFPINGNHHGFDSDEERKITILYEYCVEYRGEYSTIGVFEKNNFVIINVSLKENNGWTDSELVNRAIGNFKNIIEKDNMSNERHIIVPKELRDKVYAVISNPNKMIPMMI